jgi:hypothetical protein
LFVHLLYSITGCSLVSGKIEETKPEEPAVCIEEFTNEKYDYFFDACPLTIWVFTVREKPSTSAF